MKRMFVAAALIAAPAVAMAQSSSPAPSSAAAELTRRLNGAPPSTPAPVAPASARPAAQTTARAASASARPAGATPSAPAASAPAATAGSRPATPAAAPAAAPQTRPSPPSAPATGALGAAAIAALPFRIDLPSGVQLVEGRAGTGAHIYSVKRAGKTLAMIYTGPSSQFPIYEGEQLSTGGRTSVVVSEGAKRVAMEHLFQRTSPPAEIHVWLMTADGADRDLAERIAQSVDPKPAR